MKHLTCDPISNVCINARKHQETTSPPKTTQQTPRPSKTTQQTSVTGRVDKCDNKCRVDQCCQKTIQPVVLPPSPIKFTDNVFRPVQPEWSAYMCADKNKAVSTLPNDIFIIPVIQIPLRQAKMILLDLCHPFI